MNKHNIDSDDIPTQRSIFAAVLGLDPTPLCAGSRVVVRIGDCRAGGMIRSIGDKLRRSGDVPSSEVLLKRNDLALVETEIIAGKGGRYSSLNSIVPIELYESEATPCIATGVVLPKWNEKSSGHEPGITVWLTGLSGSGKSTIAAGLEHRLRGRVPVEMLDADVVRTHLCRDLGYTREDRDENVRRLGFLAKLLTSTGAVVLVSAISPYQAAREEVRKEIGRFIEVHVNAPLEVCESRDVKGLYKKARRGEVQRFTGIADPYEPPLAPDVECRTDRESAEESIARVLAMIEEKLKMA